MATSVNQLHKVFVYGTLKRGQPNHYLLQNAKNGYQRFLAEGTTEKPYPLVIASPANIPFLLPEGGGKNVIGEIYDVDDRMLAILDALEKHPEWYKRDAVNIILNDSSQTLCWCYFLINFKKSLLQHEFLDCYNSNELEQKGLSYLNPAQRKDIGIEEICRCVKES